MFVLHSFSSGKIFKNIFTFARGVHVYEGYLYAVIYEGYLYAVIY
jgi:hypothetical protein